MTLWPEFERGLREAIAKMDEPEIRCAMCEVTFSVSMITNRAYPSSTWTVDYCPYCGDDLSEQAYDQWEHDDDRNE